MVVPAEMKKPLFSVAALFLFFGINIGSWASRLVDIKLQHQLNDSQLSMLLLACGIGAVSALPLTLFLLKRFGARQAALLSGSAIIILLFCLSLSTHFYLSLFIMLLEGVSCAVFNTAINAIGGEFEKQLKHKIMTRLHAIFSLGAFFAALFSSGILLLTTDLWPHFLTVSIILASLLWLISPHLPEHNPVTKQDHNPKQQGTVLKTSAVLGLTIFFGTVVEGSLLDWSAIYLTDVIGASLVLAPSGVMVVSVTMVIARLYADSLRDKYSNIQLIGVGGLVSSISLVVGVTLGGLVVTWVTLAVVGLSIAAVSPCVYAIAVSKGSTNLSLVSTFGSAGSLLGPPMIGFISHQSSLVMGMYFVASCALIISILTLVLNAIGSTENENKFSSTTVDEVSIS